MTRFWELIKFYLPLLCDNKYEFCKIIKIFHIIPHKNCIHISKKFCNFIVLTLIMYIEFYSDIFNISH